MQGISLDPAGQELEKERAGSICLWDWRAMELRAEVLEVDAKAVAVKYTRGVSDSVISFLERPVVIARLLEQIMKLVGEGYLSPVAADVRMFVV